MAAEAIAKKKFSYDEYLQLEEQEQIRYEYYDGEVVAMAGGSLDHNRITSNLNRELLNALQNTSCESFQESVKLEHGKSNAFLYPDIIVTCHPEDIEASHVVKAPVLVVEVLSPSTAGRDKDEKLSIYCAIPSLRYYLLISQSKPYAELYSRTKPIAVFQYQVFKSIDDIIALPELKVELTLRQIYRNVRFQS